MKLKILTLALLFFASFANAEIFWYENLNDVLTAAKAQNKSVVFCIADKLDRVVKKIPENKDPAFIKFAEENLLFCKARIILRGKEYKFINDEIGAFVSQIIPANAKLYNNSYCLAFFKFPDECAFYQVYQYDGKTDKKSSFTTEDSYKYKRGFFSSPSSLGEAVKLFLYGEAKNRISSVASSTYSLEEPAPDKLNEISTSQDKFIVFIIAENPEEVSKTSSVFKVKEFSDYAKDNFIFVPVPTKVGRLTKKRGHVKEISFAKRMNFSQSKYHKFINSLDGMKNLKNRSCTDEDPVYLLVYKPSVCLDLVLLYEDPRGRNLHIHSSIISYCESKKCTQLNSVRNSENFRPQKNRRRNF